MSAMAFDSLRYARRLRDAGVPEPQADAHAELMAETFSQFAENMLTKDHFEAVLDARFAAQDARIEQRFLEQDARIEQRFSKQEIKFEQRFSKQDRTLALHTWMLGILVLVMVVPQLQDWLAWAGGGAYAWLLLPGWPS